MSEKLKLTVERNDAQRAQAVALLGAAACGACLLIKLGACPGKGSDVSPCPPKNSSVEVLFDGGFDPSPKSYRKELRDNSQNLVLATDLRAKSPTPKKPTPKPAQPTIPTPIPVPQKNSKPTAPIRSQPSKPRSRTSQSPESSVGEALADIARLMFGRSDTSASVAKK